MKPQQPPKRRDGAKSARVSLEDECDSSETYRAPSILMKGRVLFEPLMVVEREMR